MVIHLGGTFTGAFIGRSDSYLYLSRHNIYYFRAIVPYGVKEELHKREYRRSMQTLKLHCCRTIGRTLQVYFEAL